MAGYNNQFNSISPSWSEAYDSLWNNHSDNYQPQAQENNFRLFGVDIPLAREDEIIYDAYPLSWAPPEDIVDSSDDSSDDDSSEDSDYSDDEDVVVGEDIVDLSDDNSDDDSIEDSDSSNDEGVLVGEVIIDVAGLNEEEVLMALNIRVFYFMDLRPPGWDEECSICRENYEDGQSVGTLRCKHEFHEDCIKKWLFEKNECPICRSMALIIF